MGMEWEEDRRDKQPQHGSDSKAKHDQENDLSVSFINVAIIRHNFLRREKESQGFSLPSLRVKLSLGGLVL